MDGISIGRKERNVSETENFVINEGKIDTGNLYEVEIKDAEKYDIFRDNIYEEVCIMYLMIKKFYENLLIIYILISLFFWNTEFLKSESEFAPSVYYHFLNYPIIDDFSKSGLRIFLQVPYSDLVFIKNEDYFESTFEVNIIIWDGDNLILDKSFENSISVVEYDESESNSLFCLWYKSFEVTPKKYEIEIIFTDKNSGNISKNKRALEVKEFNDKTINISNLLFLNRIEFLPNKVVKLFPIPIGNIAVNEKNTYIYFEMYIPDENKELIIKFNILDELSEDSTVVKRGSISLKKYKKYDYFYTDLKDLDLEKGRYIVTYQIEQDEKIAETTASFSVTSYLPHVLARKEYMDRRIARTTDSLSISWEGLPETVKDFDKAIDQMIYIASSKEIEKIKEKKGYEKFKAFEEFWDKKYPSPGVNGNEKMIEYYLRMNFATKNFSSYRMPEGWLTDRGYIYVIMGKPDHTSSYRKLPFNDTYETWRYYHRNRSYTFIYEAGSGDFILVSPIYYEDSDMLN